MACFVTPKRPVVAFRYRCFSVDVELNTKCHIVEHPPSQCHQDHRWSNYYKAGDNSVMLVSLLGFTIKEDFNAFQRVES